MLSGIVIGIVVAALIALGWVLDRRAAIRREQDAMTDGIWVGKLIGIIPQDPRSEWSESSRMAAWLRARAEGSTCREPSVCTHDRACSPTCEATYKAGDLDGTS